MSSTLDTLPDEVPRVADVAFLGVGLAHAKPESQAPTQPRVRQVEPACCVQTVHEPLIDIVASAMPEKLELI